MIIHIEVDDATGGVTLSMDTGAGLEEVGQFESLPEALEAAEKSVEGSWQDEEEGDLEADLNAGYNKVSDNSMKGAAAMPQFGDEEQNY